MIASHTKQEIFGVSPLGQTFLQRANLVSFLLELIALNPSHTEKIPSFLFLVSQINSSFFSEGKNLDPLNNLLIISRAYSISVFEAEGI